MPRHGEGGAAPGGIVQAGEDEGFPVKWCTFDGTHHAAPYDGPLVNGNEDNGTTTWVPQASWDFITAY